MPGPYDPAPERPQDPRLADVLRLQAEARKVANLVSSAWFASDRGEAPPDEAMLADLRAKKAALKAALDGLRRDAPALFEAWCASEIAALEASLARATETVRAHEARGEKAPFEATYPVGVFPDVISRWRAVLRGESDDVILGSLAEA